MPKQPWIPTVHVRNARELVRLGHTPERAVLIVASWARLSMAQMENLYTVVAK